jgi:hypothetical protein
MIIVTIRKKTEIVRQVTKNFLVKSTPTDISELAYGDKKIKCIEEFKTESVPETLTSETMLLNQEITEEETFDLHAVILAINGLRLRS